MDGQTPTFERQTDPPPPGEPVTPGQLFSRRHSSGSTIVPHLLKPRLHECLPVPRFHLGLCVLWVQGGVSCTAHVRQRSLWAQCPGMGGGEGRNSHRKSRALWGGLAGEKIHFVGSWHGVHIASVYT